MLLKLKGIGLVVLLVFIGVSLVVSVKLWNLKNNQENTTTNSSVVTSAPSLQSPLSVEYLRTLKLEPTPLISVSTLPNQDNYTQSIVSYTSDGYKIYGLLTVPVATPPPGGFGAIIFVHGYLPPTTYKTTEKYVAYVNYLAKSGFVVFKIDLRGHGNSEGSPAGSYFSPTYTIDILNAVESLKATTYINPSKIGLWGHSMAGNAVLRALLINNTIKVAVIWAGAVYSYEDFAKYRLSDTSYVPRQPDPHYQVTELPSFAAEEVSKLRKTPTEVDFTTPFWVSISLTKNISYLQTPIQLHHAADDLTVNIGYSRDLSKVLDTSSKPYEFYEYAGGGHNITSPYFDQAMQRTVKFFKDYFEAVPR